MRETTPTSLRHRRDLLNQTLVDAHLIGIPSLTPLTARCFPRRDLQALGREADGALDAEVLALGPLDELLAHLFQTLYLARCQGDADLVDFLREGNAGGVSFGFSEMTCVERKWGAKNVRVLHRSPSRVSGMTCCLW